MSSPLSKLAVSAIRLTALAKFGPVAGAVMAGGAMVANVLGKGNAFGEAAASVLTELVGGKAAELLGSANKAFQNDGRNRDLEISMRLAAIQALAALHKDAPEDCHDWFKDWNDYLTRTNPDALFAGTGDADPDNLQYDDTEYRALWWSHMEPSLIRWREAENAGF